MEIANAIYYKLQKLVIEITHCLVFTLSLNHYYLFDVYCYSVLWVAGSMALQLTISTSRL